MFVFDPTDHDTFYAESQEGEVHRINLRNGELRRLRPEPTEGAPRYRFHWNSPILMSRHKPGIIYLGGNYVFRLTDRAEKYSVISPDLTRNDPAQNKCDRQRRGELRRHVFTRGIAEARGIALGGNRRRSALDNRKRRRQMDRTDRTTCRSRRADNGSYASKRRTPIQTSLTSRRTRIGPATIAR